MIYYQPVPSTGVELISRLRGTLRISSFTVPSHLRPTGSCCPEFGTNIVISPPKSVKPVVPVILSCRRFRFDQRRGYVSRCGIEPPLVLILVPADRPLASCPSPPLYQSTSGVPQLSSAVSNKPSLFVSTASSPMPRHRRHNDRKFV